MDTKIRCRWCGSDELYQTYHDLEWGIPEHRDEALFELLILEGFQAGLSWITILKRREAFREAFAQFDYHVLSNWTDTQLEAQMQNEQIIRNRLKINAVRTNALAFIKIQEKFGSFNHYIWEFVGHTPILNKFAHHGELPASTEISELLSKSLKRNGFRFVGPTICYALMQAAGLVNDHTTECFRHPNNC
ncbi:MAG: DNA-3-methyladenine glycosylase I [Cytophagales bacterium]|nr:DNA-3-methyladenine glycosylase I [Cytophagales bacterium]